VWHAAQEWFFEAGVAYWCYTQAQWVKDWDVWTVVTTKGKGKGAQQEWIHLETRPLPFF